MRKWGIVGALLFVAACVVGFIFNFDGSDIVAIGLATFGLTATVIAFVKKHKEKGTPIWQIAIVTVLTLMKHKLKSRLLGEIPTTPDIQMTPPLWQKTKRN